MNGCCTKALLFTEALVQSRFVTSVIPCHFSTDLMYQATDIMPWCALVLFTVYLFNAFNQFYYFFIFLKYTYTWILDFRLQENRYSICLEKLKAIEYTVIPLCNSRNDTFPKWCDDKISFSTNLKIVKIPLSEKNLISFLVDYDLKKWEQGYLFWDHKILVIYLCIIIKAKHEN